MRTDTERLDWLLDATETQSYDAGERLQAAFTLGLRGRTALDAAMGAKLVEPGEPMPELTALDMAVAELGRIRNVKGFSEERDDGYVDGELADVAACYLIRDAGAYWPEDWNRTWWKPSPDDRKKELTKGIALAVCELDRLIRAERREAQVCAEMNAAACEPAFCENPNCLHHYDAQLAGCPYCSKPQPREPVTIGIDMASGPDVCVVDGVVQPQPREFKEGDRVKCNDPEIPELPKDAVGTLVHRTALGWTVNLDCQPNGFAYFREDEMEHVDG